MKLEKDRGFVDMPFKFAPDIMHVELTGPEQVIVNKYCFHYSVPMSNTLHSQRSNFAGQELPETNNR